MWITFIFNDIHVNLHILCHKEWWCTSMNCVCDSSWLLARDTLLQMTFMLVTIRASIRLAWSRLKLGAAVTRCCATTRSRYKVSTIGRLKTLTCMPGSRTSRSWNFEYSPIRVMYASQMAVGGHGTSNIVQFWSPQVQEGVDLL